MTFDLPSLGLVIGAAIISAINPCVLAACIMVLSAVLGGGKSSRRLLILGCAFICGLLVTYLLFGFALTYLIDSLSVVLANYLSLAIGVAIVVVGLLEIRQYFWYGKGPSLQIPRYFTNKIHEHSGRKTSVLGITLLGVFAGIATLPCAGLTYLAVLMIMRSDLAASSLWPAALFSIIFVLPILFILTFVVKGSKISVVTKWKEESKGTMRLFIGLLLVSLGWILLLLANGTINFG